MQCYGVFRTHHCPVSIHEIGIKDCNRSASAEETLKIVLLKYSYRNISSEIFLLRLMSVKIKIILINYYEHNVQYRIYLNIVYQCKHLVTNIICLSRCMMGTLQHAALRCMMGTLQHAASRCTMGTLHHAARWACCITLNDGYAA